MEEMVAQENLEAFCRSRTILTQTLINGMNKS